MRIEDGVAVHDVIGPTYQTLRPLGRPPVVPGVFPVYPDLVSKLVTPAHPADPDRRHPDKVVAHVLATLAGYAYADADTVSMMMTRMGLEKNRCRMIGEYVDAMFIDSTAFLVQSADGRVVLLAYRGTEPKNIISWLTDADVHPDKVGFQIGTGGPYDVHAGFYRNVRATRFKVAEALRRASEGLPITAPHEASKRIRPMEALYITGHSMGGTLAAVMGLMLRTDDAYRDNFEGTLEAVYTIGQPMIGSPALAAACAAAAPFFTENVIRYIYQKDPIPHCPPRDTGPFANFGSEYHFTGKSWVRNAKPVGQLATPLALLGAGGNFLIRQFPALRWLTVDYQFDDHFPHHYIAALTPPGVPTEFGDYSYTSPNSHR